MQCPNCEETDLPPRYKFCPNCTFPLQRAQNVPTKSTQTLLQQSGASAKGNIDHGVVDKRQIQGESQQPNVLTAGREQPHLSTGQHLGPTQQPDKDKGTDQHDQKPTEEKAGTSENDQHAERTPAISPDHGHKGAVGSKGLVTSTIRGSETPAEERAGSTEREHPHGCAPSNSFDHDHENAVGPKGPSVTNTFRGSETPAEKTAGPKEREERQEGTPSSSSDHGHEKAVGSKGPAGEKNTIGDSETPAEERVGQQKNDQRLESTPPISSFESNEKAVYSKGSTVTNATGEPTGDQMMSGGTVPTTTLPLEGQREPISNEALREGNAASETTVPALYTSDVSSDGNPAETVRGPAEIPNSPELRDINSAEQTTMPEKPDGRQTVRDDRNRQEGKQSGTEERHTTESGENPPPTVCTTTTFTQPQQKAPEKEDPLGASSKLEDDKEFAQGYKNEGGVWYRKGDTQQQKPPGTQKGMKNQNKEEKGSSSTERQASTTQPPSILQQVKPEAGVTVVFHVLLASNFKMTEESFNVRAAGVDLGDFYLNCVDMREIETDKSKDKDKLLLYRGQFTISLDRARKGTFYKYVVVKKGAVYWEELPEFPPHHYSTIVDRALKIPDDHIEPGSTWNQFDGVAYVYGDKGMLSRVMDIFSRDKTVEYRTKALLCFLPKWRGFVVNEAAEKMDAKKALMKLQKVVKCLTNVWIQESSYRRERKPANFEVRKALVDFLKPKMAENITTLAKYKVGSSAHVSAVVSSLAIIVLVKIYHLQLIREEAKSLLSCLSLEADPTEKKCTAYEAVLAEFSTEFRESAASGIESLCNQLMKDAWAPNPEWLLAVPLLHFLRGDSKPFEEPDIGGSPKTLVWWGAQKLNITEFQRSDKQ
ncbi:hypothetical protein ACROYT_G002834 [Oculina patagonica]